MSEEERAYFEQFAGLSFEEEREIFYMKLDEFDRLCWRINYHSVLHWFNPVMSYPPIYP